MTGSYESPTRLEKAIIDMVDIFHKYASKDGVNETMTRGEFADLLQNGKF